MHIKKQKGDLGVVHAIAETTSQGWNVSLPITEHASYDFIAENNGVCKRVQVKYTTPNSGVLKARLRSCWADRHGSHARKREKRDFDILAIYNPNNKRTYFIDSNDFDNGTQLLLRLSLPKHE